MNAIMGIAAWSGLFLTQSLQAQDVSIYSHRQSLLIGPFLAAFTKKTRIENKVLYLKKVLEQRLKSEGRNSPTDVVLTVTIARISVYIARGLIGETNSGTLEKKFMLI